MSSISDADLRKYSENAKGKVVIITGGAMGLGKRAGGEFIRAGYVHSLELPELNQALTFYVTAPRLLLGISTYQLRRRLWPSGKRSAGTFAQYIIESDPS